jgi:CBS domain-containing protein
MVFVLGTFSGIWLAFIGWFLLQASAAESRAIMRRDPLAGLRVGDVMVRDPVTARPDQTLDDFLDRVAWSSRHTAYPVVDDGRALGIIPFRCFSEVPRSEWPTRRVADCMVARDALATLTEEDDLNAAVAALRRSGLGRTLVLDGERLVGLLSISDVARAVA